jgi:predicted amidohydrolase
MEDLVSAAVQMNSRMGDIEGNTAKILGFSAQAASLGCDIVCFPELSVTGYGVLGSAENACSAEDIGAILDASADLGIAICAGMAEREGDSVYITHFAAEAGRLAGTYRKTHLGEREATVFEPGDSVEVIRTSKARIGFQLCWESHFPEISCMLGLGGADIIYMPHASGLPPERRRSVWSTVLPARANDNTVYVSAGNLAGDGGGGTVFGGGLMSFDPRGCLLGEDHSGRESLLVTAFPSEPVERIRGSDGGSMRNLYYLRQRRPELYGIIADPSRRP